MDRHEYLLPLALGTALAISGCSSAAKDWTDATAQNTVAAYQFFLNKHAGDSHAADARQRLAALQDDSTWKTAQNGNSVDSYQQYLQSEPNGAHAQAARDQITALQRQSAWQTARSQGTATALQAFLQQYPQGPEADQAREKLEALNSEYRAELGAFRDKRAAERKLAQLKSRFSGVFKQVEVLSPDSSTKRYRVMSGLMERHAADSACASLERAHQNCEVVKTDQTQS